MSTNIRELAEQYNDYIIERRRYYHSCPELSGQEIHTTEALKADLEAMGVEVELCKTCHGLVSTIKGGKPGKAVVALRSDTDALPVEEKTGLPFASENPGVMHACGHDNHMAMLLGAAKILCEVKDELEGNVKLLFQAAEETCFGAEYYVQQGVLDGVDAIYGQHIWAGLEAPYLNVQPGVRMASCDNFTITVEGSSTHGSTPHLGTDAIVAAASIIMNIQTIVSRNNDPLNALVVSIGEIHGGQRFNILANKVVMEGTCRTHSREMRGKIEPLLRRICEDTAAAFGAKAELKYDAFPSPVINDHDDLNQIAHDAAVKLYGEEGIKEMPRVMGSEDFAFFMEEVPGVFGFIGSRDPEQGYIYTNHHEKYSVPEEVLQRGAAMHAQFALDFLTEKAGE